MDAATPWPLLGLRLGIGFLQGVALYLVAPPIASLHPPVDRGLTAVALVCLIFVPCAINLAIPIVRPLRATGWAVLLCIVFGGLTDYRAWLMQGAADPLMSAWPVVLTSSHVDFVILFIAQALLLAGSRDARLIARYPTYFDVAWGQAVQIILGVAFTALLCGIIGLGAELFAIIGLKGFLTAVEQSWFIYPLIATGFAFSINITDIRVQLLRTSRSLFLTLAAWLLPVLTVLTLCFLLALPVTGLAPLWATHRAGVLLVLAAFFLVLLINAVYGDGLEGTASPRALKAFASVACVLLAPITLIAAYGAVARIGQHGLTPARIFLVADILVILIYAILYPLGLIRRRRGWLPLLQTANLSGAYAVIALILLLWSPLLNPMRLSVADQMARLHDGRVRDADFDYDFLRFDAGRYGGAALKTLQSGWDGPNATLVARRATEALSRKYRFDAIQHQPPPLADAERTAQVTVYPAGAVLPADFARTDFTGKSGHVPQCLIARGFHCDAILLDVLKLGRPQILFVSVPQVLVAQDAPGTPWRVVANLAGPAVCPKVLDSLRRGDIHLVPHAWPDIQVAGKSLPLNPPDVYACPP